MVNFVEPIMPITPSLTFDFAGIELDRKQGLSRQLYQTLRQRILDGRLSSGTRLPSSRDLAMALTISRNSVMRAYDQLYAEGFTEGRMGDGTYVAQLPEKSRPANKVSTKMSTGLSPGLPTALSTIPANVAGDLSSKVIHSSSMARLEQHHLKPHLKGLPRAFRVGIPAFDLFPFDVWGKLHAAFWRRPGLHQLGYGDPAGEWRLRELIAVYLRTSRDLHCVPEQIVITSGAQQAITLCAQLLLNAGDGVAIENPGYRAAGHAFAVAGATLHGMPVDGEGMRSPEHKDKGCKLAYVTPSHQYPLGVTMSLGRRLELLAWAERTQGWIVEDDYDGEYRYSGAPLAPLAALDRNGRVLYVGTFGKIAFPALRLGYLVLPHHLVKAFSQRRAVDMRHSEIGTQAVMAEFIAAGHFQRHIRRMRRAALSRRDALLAGWPEDVRGCSSMPKPVAGLHVSVAVDSLEREKHLIATAESVGVELSPLSEFWLPDSDTPVDNRAGLVLGFAGVPEADITSALERLRGVWI